MENAVLKGRNLCRFQRDIIHGFIKRTVYTLKFIAERTYICVWWSHGVLVVLLKLVTVCILSTLFENQKKEIRGGRIDKNCLQAY
jgi:hypothetical protein